MLIGYARKSTKDQNTSLQEDALRIHGCEKIFTETASGAKDDREELAKAIAFCQKGDVLVVWKIDRMARSLSRLLDVVSELGKKGAHIKSVTEAWLDTTTPAGTLMFQIFGALAQFERTLIVERTKAGLEAARKNGRIGGRKPILTEAEREKARAMAYDPDRKMLMSEIVKEFRVSKSAFYRSIGPR